MNRTMFNGLKRHDECWHEWSCFGLFVCTKCGARSWEISCPDFTTWEGFGWMWERAIEKEWWPAFLYSYILFGDNAITHLVNPERFRDALYQFIKEMDANRRHISISADVKKST